MWYYESKNNQLKSTNDEFPVGIFETQHHMIHKTCVLLKSWRWYAFYSIRRNHHTYEICFDKEKDGSLSRGIEVYNSTLIRTIDEK